MSTYPYLLNFLENCKIKYRYNNLLQRDVLFIFEFKIIILKKRVVGFLTKTLKGG